MKENKWAGRKEKLYLLWIAVILFLLFLLSQFTANSIWVERYYSTGFYPKFSLLNKILFSWIPFSLGDIFYLLLLCYFVYSFFQICKRVFNRSWVSLRKETVSVGFYILLLYSFFYINWGINYLRPPVSELIGLDLDVIEAEDYERVLEKYIPRMNAIRSQLNLDDSLKHRVADDIEFLMKEDSLFDSFLSKTQVKIKKPISSRLISHMGVAGYFNPFTSEVQVNQDIPKSSFPFVNVHELAHQMGIGFEDDCNFIAFRKLIYHENLWYQYAAYFNAINPLLLSVSNDKVKLEKFKTMISNEVKMDMEAEYVFWRSRTGWLDKLLSFIYDGYLKHNNQPEGLSRYNMMARLIVAWEMQQ